MPLGQRLSLLWLLPTVWGASSTTDVPLINFNALGSVSVVGAFDGLTLYTPADAAAFSTAESTLLSRNSEGEYTRLGRTNTGGTISSICHTPGLLYVGGQFSSLGGVNAQNIASYNTETTTFSPLGDGLDGQVKSISCSSDSVYVGGSFASPTGQSGNVAMWNPQTSTWTSVPFDGLNGPVEVIERSSDSNSLLLGGTFSTQYRNSTTTLSTLTSPTTRNLSEIGGPGGVVYSSLGSSLAAISLNGSEYTASPTSFTSGFGRPETIFCPQREDGVGGSWLMDNGSTGTFISRLFRPVSARGIRLGNTFWNGYGTRTFSLVSIPNNHVIQLQYSSDPTDPNSPILTCSDSCPLSHDPQVAYQDFIFPEAVTLTGFQLNILSWYGDGGGLHLLQLLSDGAFVYGVSDNNAQPCTNGLAASQPSLADSWGEWTRGDVVTDIAGTVQRVNYGTVSSANPGSSMTWSPWIRQSGQYRITFSTPGCSPQDDCSDRTSVTVSTRAGYSSVATSVDINQNTANTLQTTIFEGFLFASANDLGGAQINLSVASSVDLSRGPFRIVADSINLVAASTNGTIFPNTTFQGNTSLVDTVNQINVTSQILQGYGFYEYALSGGGAFGDAVTAAENSDATEIMSNATLLDQFASRLATGANVSAIASDVDTVFVAGSFRFSTPTGSSSNIAYIRRGTGSASAPNGGLNGHVYGLVARDGALYAGGDFTASADGSITGLEGTARWVYTVAGSSWEAIGSSPLGTDIVEVASSGSNIVAIGGRGVGLAVFDTVSNSWNSSASGNFFGNLSAIAGDADTLYAAGRVTAVASVVAPGGGLLTSSDGATRISGYRFLLNDEATTVSNSNSTSRNRKRNASISAKLSRSVKRAISAIVPRQAIDAPLTSLPSAVNLGTSGEVLTGTYWKNGSTTLMLLGGTFVSMDGVRGLGIYNGQQGALTSLPGIEINGAVNTVKAIENIAWIGGNFTTGTGRVALTTYALNNSTTLDYPPSLEGYSNSRATVNVIASRPGYSNEIVVGGVFAGTAAVEDCRSICSWDSKTREWASFSTGLEGVVGSIAFAGGKSQYLLAAGSFTINGTLTHLAQWNYDSSSWTTFGGANNIPGPATAVSYDGSDNSKIFVAGVAENNEPYLYHWDGISWTDINDNKTLGGSIVQQLVFVPLAQKHTANSIIETDRMLLVSGDISVNETSVSSALFDGSNWYPYLISSDTRGGKGAITEFFYSVTDFSLSGKHLAIGLVILISIAIGLGIVFLLVLLGLLFTLAHKRDDSNYPVQQPTSDKQMVLDRPTSLLTTVGAATAVMLDDSKNEKDAAVITDGGTFDDERIDNDMTARARYSFQGEHQGELSVSAGEDLVILDGSDANWYLVSNAQGQRGLMPAAYLV